VDTKTLVIGQKVHLLCGGLLGEPKEPTEATVTEITDEYVTLELEKDDGLVKDGKSRWGVVFKNGEQWGGIWILHYGLAQCEWDRRFKAVFEEGEHTKPHKFTLSKAHEATH